jgi:hypothetical protein
MNLKLEEDEVLLKIDFRNALNSLARKSIIQSTAHHCKEIL